MYRQAAVLALKEGLHARPAADFVRTAKQYRAAIWVEFGGRRVSAQSLIAVLSLGIRQGAEITIAADGEDEQAAVQELVGLVTGAGTPD